MYLLFEVLDSSKTTLITLEEIYYTSEHSQDDLDVKNRKSSQINTALLWKLNVWIHMELGKKENYQPSKTTEILSQKRWAVC